MIVSRSPRSWRRRLSRVAERADASASLAASDGRAWHHKPHRWPAKKERYDRHRADLATMVEPLRTMGITLWNASPGSAYADLWPVVSLQDVLTGQRRAA